MKYLITLLDEVITSVIHKHADNKKHFFSLKLHDIPEASEAEGLNFTHPLSPPNT